MADRSDLDPDDPSNADAGQASGLALSPDDPLRAWVQSLDDPGMAALLATDPEKAKEIMIQRGIAPPPHATPYADATASSDPEAAGGMQVPAYPPDSGANAPIRTASDGSIMGNITSPASPTRAVNPPASNVLPVPTSPTNALDPEETASTIPLPQERPKEAGPGASDLSAKKKDKDYAGALGDFSKSLAGVKPVQPPPVNPVGTPSVRSPSSSGAPNIANLLAMAGQQAQQHALAQTLGRLLVAGKA